MSEEIKFDHFKDINELLENIDLWYREDDIEYTRWFGLEDLYNLKIYITHLQQKVEQLEKEKNTLMYSLTLVRQKWNNDKARYRRKAKVYREQRNQLENIRKEAIKYILKNKLYRFKYDDEELFEITTDKKAKDDLLNILNKGSDKE